MKKPVEIETLLQWALRDEMPKGKPVSSDIGDIVRRAGRRPRGLAHFSLAPRPSVDALGMVAGAPHPDAEIIARCVARLPTLMLAMPARSDAALMLGDLAAVAGDDDLAALTATRTNPQALVISCAVQGKRPQWDIGRPRPRALREEYRDTMGRYRARSVTVGIVDGVLQPLIARRGKAAMMRGLYDLGSLPRSLLHWCEPTVIGVAEARADYDAWHWALRDLVTRLDGALCDHVALPPAAMPLPWITGQTPDPRVLDDGLPAGLMTVRLPLQPKRAAALPPLESDIAQQARLWRGRKARRNSGGVRVSDQGA